jgi:replicative DNA helicase
VPPHNIEAEESLLGALLLSRDAIGVVAEMGLEPGDFYKPAHQHVYEAVKALSGAGQPVDPITVGDELRRVGLLDEIGGSAMLLELQNATPAISNAARYAKIVQDTAMLRRLIGVASQIAELAYNEPDDVTKALDEAETRVFEVAERRVTDSTRPLSDLLSHTMDQLQETFERGSAITGTPTGLSRPRRAAVGSATVHPEHRRCPTCHGQERVRAGHGHPRGADHQPAGAVLLAGDGSCRAGPAHPGLRGPRRLPEAAHRSTHESDWSKIGRAIGRLEVPLHLDDNPSVTVMEIRAKARRVKSRTAHWASSSSTTSSSCRAAPRPRTASSRSARSAGT